LNSKVKARFFSKVDLMGPVHPVLKTRCHVWKAYRTSTGYGHFGYNQEVYGAHRVAWLIHYGSWPKLQVLHLCDNPSCVRWDHLFEGNQKDNVKDMCSKKRRASTAGSKNPNAKLSDTQALEIIRSKESGPQLARRYNVNHTTIYAIRRSKLRGYLQTRTTPEAS